ncbi:hypothetical protein KAI65_05060 [Candidatus Parcubacteria bacterium]|nr:hypothetical protein [Candidatus Parcubacteria bacterium]
MNIKIIKSLTVIIAVSAVIASISYTTAFFQDTEVSENNVFEAGTLDLVINEPANAVWTAENWLPGDEVEGELEFENVGSLPIESLVMEVEIN